MSLPFAHFATELLRENSPTSKAKGPGVSVTFHIITVQIQHSLLYRKIKPDARRFSRSSWNLLKLSHYSSKQTPLLHLAEVGSHAGCSITRSLQLQLQHQPCVHLHGSRSEYHLQQRLEQLIQLPSQHYHQASPFRFLLAT